jgi:hypothetical protein
VAPGLVDDVRRVRGDDRLGTGAPAGFVDSNTLLDAGTFDWAVDRRSGQAVHLRRPSR